MMGNREEQLFITTSINDESNLPLLIAVLQQILHINYIPCDRDLARSTLHRLDEEDINLLLHLLIETEVKNYRFFKEETNSRGNCIVKFLRNIFCCGF